MIEKLFSSCSELSKVPLDAADGYAEAFEKLLDHVNDQLESNPDVKKLIGGNPLDVMRNNHHNHAAFMSSIFRINSFELLVRTVPWVYRAYRARGFLYAYFPAELVAWQIAIHECLEQKTEILAVYAWMVAHHDEMIQLAESGEGLSFSLRQESCEMEQIFLALLLNGDSRGASRMAEQSIHTPDDMKRFYLDVVWPAMADIGHLWELNRISVAEEHLATAIVGRVMAALYARFDMFDITRGKAVVSAGPNEFHEIGARMVADFMEMGGWDVTYLGANTPSYHLVEHLKREKPFVLALSVATVFNFENARKLIQDIRESPEISGTKVIAGGLAFSQMPELYQEIGADGYAPDAESAVSVADAWWLEVQK